MRFPTMWYVRPAKAQTSLRIRADWSEPLLVVEYYVTVKLLTEHHLKFLCLTGGCTGSSESTLIKMPHYWKSRVAAQLCPRTLWQGRRRWSGRTASAGPLFWTSMLSAVSLFSCFGSFFFVLTSDFQFIDAIINNARCACHPLTDLANVWKH